MTDDDRYRVTIGRAARRALSEELPEAVAVAAFELIHGALRENPRRVGKPLRALLAGQWVARKSTYRITYRIDDKTHTVHVIDIDGRADIYRPH
ncbi:type II toxin-antitoxin system RelE family toxin [Paractinoplanes ovalisporus]|uniref:type II toxin-antitoxin system RelE family toxin n=1 Tax=Paractinoplanes ovalisporus TaxID=2810368 RepID=UPI0027DE8492|nr:type II toxin-antitoxin system RelE/ParE family toxin [Actinoplanes ovalisporus]